MTHLKLACAGAAALALLVVAAARSLPAAKPVPAKVAEEEVWPMKKADRLVVAPSPVVAERAESSVAPRLSAPAKAPPVTVADATTRPAASDVCTRHGLHKVVTGKSWRCR